MFRSAFFSRGDLFVAVFVDGFDSDAFYVALVALAGRAVVLVGALELYRLLTLCVGLGFFGKLGIGRGLV